MPLLLRFFETIYGTGSPLEELLLSGDMGPTDHLLMSGDSAGNRVRI